LCHDAVVQHGDDEGLLQLAVLEARTFDDDVVGLPLAGGARGVAGDE